MDFRITGLSPEPFRALYGLPEAELAKHRATRRIVDHKPGYPDRIELTDAEPGEAVLLVHHVHQPADTPFHASHAIYVREWAENAYDRVNELPPVFRSRVLSLRAFDAEDMLIDAELVEGASAADAIERLLSQRRTAYVHAHYAKMGCFAARIDRA